MDEKWGLEDGRLILPRCPHCGIASPLFVPMQSGGPTKEFSKRGTVTWTVHRCQTCGFPTITFTVPDLPRLDRILPGFRRPHNDLPERAQDYLRQAMDSATVAPSGAITLCASAVDAMLKAKGYREGSLYERIDKGTQDRLITDSMAAWAHDVRLDANAERHADDSYRMPLADDARRCIDFVVALGEFIFVLPKRVEEGRQAAKAAEQGPAKAGSEAPQSRPV